MKDQKDSRLSLKKNVIFDMAYDMAAKFKDIDSSIRISCPYPGHPTHNPKMYFEMSCPKFKTFERLPPVSGPGKTSFGSKTIQFLKHHKLLSKYIFTFN